MNSLLPPALGNHSQFMARQRIEGMVNLPKLFSAIDADPNIVGAGVVYIDSTLNIVTLREFQPICSIRPKRVILREIEKYQTPEQYTEVLQNSARESKLIQEAVNTSLACAGAVLGWIVVCSGTIAAPFTAGTSLVLTYIGGAAAAASGAQCLIGGIRTVREVTNPAANDALDSEPWYQAASLVLDGVSLLGVGASALTTIKYLQVVKARTGRSWYELGKTLSRQQRKALTDELLSLKHPALTAKQLKLEQAASNLTKRYTPTQVSHATRTLIKDSVSAVFGFVGNARVQSVAVGLYEELE
ncbi:NAD synthetase [Pseudomonas cremoricolorata]|uniref:NAD synthetase n=2 Tax=Pseudomonas cremoricolorata TaxID=157783 RepID=A0A089Y9U3_9PSED|nr:NAD synthetase [Pseudomonas cremoricolorata]